jgi:hypothetical protein
MRPILAKPLFRVDLPQYCVVCRFRGWHAKVEHHPPSQPGLLSMVGSSDTFADNLRPSHIVAPTRSVGERLTSISPWIVGSERT